jgi:PAS domain S-box-containing protein
MTNSFDQAIAFRVTPRAAKVLVFVLLLSAAIAEIAFTPANVLVPIIYPAVIAACLWTRDVRILWGTVLISIVMAIFLQRFAMRPPIIDPNQLALFNRIAAVLTTVMVAVFVDRGIRTYVFAEFQMTELEGQYSSLELLNTELSQREEEIVRQNEELQSQTEELERQTEELRVTNEELASWEKRLEQLLELSRSLTAGTERSEVFTRICEALGTLVETHSACLLLREGNDLRIHCHHGFGPNGPQEQTIPYAASFSGQIMLLGQTGYVEDIDLRPDLKIPRPGDGSEFRAVMATPIRIEGRIIGTIEAYCPTPRCWSVGEVTIIESLAVQAAKSIQEADYLETIRYERRRFEAALRTVPVGMAIADDPQGHRVRLNGAAASIFELPSDENISLTLPVGARLATRFFQGDAAIAAAQLPISRALRGEEVHGIEFELRTHQGKRISLLASAAPILNEAGDVTGAAAAFVNITPQKLLERELDLRRREAEEASLRKTRFLAAVSHDIRTPANAINIMAEVIRRLVGDPTRSTEITEMATRLQANIHVLMELVGDMLDIARFDTGKMDLSMSEFSLAELIEQEMNQVRPLVQDKSLELAIEPMTRGIWLRTDRVKLGRVLGNLLGNAIKFTERGAIKIRTNVDQHDGRRLTLEVEDTGIGISAEHLEWIFDEFAQLQNPARDRSAGSGLGLAICKRIVELLGGTIAVKSHLGQGSTFAVTLPASVVVLRTEILSSGISENESVQKSDPLSLRILVVEDHNVTRDGTSRILREEGAIVTEARDGKTGLELLRNSAFDIVLLDMMLPDLDGREILRNLQQKRPATLQGTLVLTGDLTEERLQEVRSLGADGIIPKPVELPKLLQVLRSFRR